MANIGSQVWRAKSGMALVTSQNLIAFVRCGKCDMDFGSRSPGKGLQVPAPRRLQGSCIADYISPFEIILSLILRNAL